jgi:ParB/RepB/Spo0J family partition protein
MELIKKQTQQNTRVNIKLITTCPQDRTDFDSPEMIETIQGLASDIKNKEDGYENGLIQPIIVKPKNDKGLHEIVDGETRYRACLLLEYEGINIEITYADKMKTSFIQLSSNIKRKGLNKIDEANAYKRRMLEFNLSVSEIAGMIGEDTRRINRSLQYLKLPECLQKLVYDKLIEDINTLSKAAKIDENKLLDNIALFREGKILSSELYKEDRKNKPVEINTDGGTIKETKKKITISLESAAIIYKRLVRCDYDLSNANDVRKITTYFKAMDKKNI